MMSKISSKFVPIAGFLLYIVLLMSPLSIKYDVVEPGFPILVLATAIFEILMIYFIYYNFDILKMFINEESCKLILHFISFMFMSSLLLMVKLETLGLESRVILNPFSSDENKYMTHFGVNWFILLDLSVMIVCAIVIVGIIFANLRNTLNII